MNIQQVFLLQNPLICSLFSTYSQSDQHKLDHVIPKVKIQLTISLTENLQFLPWPFSDLLFSSLPLLSLPQ